MLTRTSSSRVPRAALALDSRRLLSVPSWATVDPNTMSARSPGIGHNMVGGKWVGAAKVKEIPDPLNGGTMMKVPDTAVAEVNEYIERMKNCPRSGLHNPIKNPERYSMLGAVMADTAREMKKPEVAEFFARLIQRVVPKSMPQCTGEPTVARKFMENYSCDQVRFLAQSFGVPGDHAGQVSTGLRFPYGGVAVITPFNFPLEIPALQTLSALFMGNQPLTKVSLSCSFRTADIRCPACGSYPPNAPTPAPAATARSTARSPLSWSSLSACCTTAACPRRTWTFCIRTGPS